MKPTTMFRLWSLQNVLLLWLVRPKIVELNENRCVVRIRRVLRELPALAVPPDRVLDTSGAGDVFHGAYVYSYLTDAAKSWDEHFRFARAASTYKIQHLGNEAGLPTLADIWPQLRRS